MILDNHLLLADAATSTVSVASTNVIDQTAGQLNPTSMASAIAIFSVPTSWVVSGTNTVTIQLQASDDENFLDSTSETLSASSAIDPALFVAGYLLKFPVPSTNKRYLRMYKVHTGNSGANYVTSAYYTMAIVKDAPVTNELA